ARRCTVHDRRGHPDTDAHIVADVDADAHTDAHPDAYTHADAHPDPDAHSDARTDGHAAVDGPRIADSDPAANIDERAGRQHVHSHSLARSLDHHHAHRSSSEAYSRRGRIGR